MAVMNKQIDTMIGSEKSKASIGIDVFDGS
jgi:hypothetical protein